MADSTTNGVATLSPLDVLTLEETAAYVRLPVATVQQEAQSGQLRGRCFDGEWRFSRAAILNWLNGHENRLTSQTNTSLGVSHTDEDQESFMAEIMAYRDEIDRVTGSGKYASE